MYKSKLPLVSVIMPVYNAGDFLVPAIESILKQTYQKFELIIVNDHSTDATYQILRSYQKQFPKKIKVINLTKRHGAYGAANIGILQARGDFIAPMDSDDISHPQRLKKQVKCLLSNPQVIVVGTQANVIDKNNHIIGQKTFPTRHQEIYKKFLEVHPIVHPSCMIRRNLLPQKNKLYEDKFGVNDDYFTFFTLFKYGKFANLPEYLLDYRIHLGNSSLQNIKQKFFNTIKIRFIAIRSLGYKPTLGGLVKMLGQIVFVAPLPESLLLISYLLIKEVYSPQEIKMTITKKLDFAFAKARKFSFALIGILMR